MTKKYNKKNLKNLGRAGDTYEDVIRKMYDITKKHILESCLYDETDSISMAEAIKNTKNEWQRQS